VAKIAVLHTSFVFVNVELRVQQLLDEMLPDDEIIHFVDSDVLATVVREGGISADREKRMVLLADCCRAGRRRCDLLGVFLAGPGVGRRAQRRRGADCQDR
jgi:hypothetical protein